MRDDVIRAVEAHLNGLGTVSYTHLDVYKRQALYSAGKVTAR